MKKRPRRGSGPRTPTNPQEDPAKAGHYVEPAIGTLFWWQIIALWIFAFAIRLLYIWQIRPSPFFDVLIGDARGYDAWGRRIAGGDWIGADIFYQAPLYPYFLGAIYAIAGRDLLVVRICQAAIGAATCALVALAGRRMYSEKIGLIAGLGLALYAPAIFFDGVLQKSVLDLFFVAWVLWLLSGLLDDPNRRSRWFSLGLVLGGLALTRENALLLIAPIVLWRPRAATGVALALGLMLVLFPVAARNRLVGGEWHLTTSQFGPNFYLGNNPDADGTAGALREGRGSAEYERQDATDLAQAAMGRTLTPSEVSRFWLEKALAFIRSDPGGWLKLEARKVALLWNRAELIDTESQESYEEWSPLLRAAARIAHFGVLAPLAILGVAVRWDDRKRLWVYYAMAATYAASVVMFFVSARYRLPLVPLLMLFAAAGVASLSSFARSAGAGALAATAAAVAATAVFANWPMWSGESMRAVTENNLGNVLQTDRRLPEAEQHYKRAIELSPEYTPAYVNLGDALIAQGRHEEAAAAYKQAAALPAVVVDLDARIGNALLQAGRPVDAIVHFQRALAAGESAEVLNNLIAAFIAANRPDEAIAAFRRAITQDPNNGVLRFRLGTFLIQRGRFDEAIPEFRSGLALVPDSAEGHDNLGVALAASGRVPEAIAEWEEALRLKPDLVNARRNLDMARERK